MKQKTEIKVFIASPGDTTTERDLIHRHIEEWNSTYGDDHRNIELKIVRWEKDLAIRSNITPQDAINEDLLQECDILIGMFWTRFGSPTNKAESGTLEEIQYFLNLNKPILMYFLDKPIKPSEMSKYAEQLNKINEFKSQYRSNNIYKETDLNSPDEFRAMFIKDLNRNVNLLINDQKSINSTNNPDSKNTNDKSDDSQWYTKSIKKIIESKLADQNMPLAYRREISFDENVKLWRSSVEVRHPDVFHKLTRAREDAFNIKYGHYNYERDLRENYKDTWFSPILSLLEKQNFLSDKKLNILGVASNNGLELDQVFKNFSNANLNVLDLSEVAIRAGQKMRKNINFISGNMEDSTIPNSAYDIYLNLRSIHSSGVDTRMTLAECYRILKPNGMAIISISNGYLTPNEIRPSELVETKGMYDNKVEAFSTDKPYDLIEKIRVKLDNYGFRSIEVHTGDTEIFIKAIK